MWYCLKCVYVKIFTVNTATCVFMRTNCRTETKEMFNINPWC